jgi:hypothetical protein
LPLFPIPSPSFIDETTPSSNCSAFPLLLLKHHYQQLFTIFFPILKHHCSTLYILPTPKTLQSTIPSPFSIDETTPSNNCFAFSFPLLKHHCQQPFIIFPDAETPLFITFDFFPMLKHHCSTLSTFS